MLFRTLLQSVSQTTRFSIMRPNLSRRSILMSFQKLDYSSQASNEQPKEKHWGRNTFLVGGTVSIFAAGTLLAEQVKDYVGTFVEALLPEEFQKAIKKNFQNFTGTTRLTNELILASEHIEPALNSSFPYFVQRDQALQALERAFKEGREYSGVARIVLYGSAGAGKTILAEMWAQKHAEKYKALNPQQPVTVKIFRAGLRSELMRQYREFAKELGIEVYLYEDEALIPLVERALSNRRDWLLVFDDVGLYQNAQQKNETDATNYEKIADLIPKANFGQKGFVIMTSRTKDVPNDDLVSGTVCLDISSPTLAMTSNELCALWDKALTSSHSDYEKNIATKQTLGTLLGPHPNAIIKAGAYARMQKKSLHQLHKELLEKNEEKGIKKNPNSVIQNLLWQYLESRPKELHDLLEFIAFLDPSSIHRELLLRYQTKNGISTLQATAIINELLNYSVLEDCGNDHYRVHPSFSDLIRERLWARLDGNDNPYPKKYYQYMLKHGAFTRDNTETSKIVDNSLWVPHIPFIQQHLTFSPKVSPEWSRVC